VCKVVSFLLTRWNNSKHAFALHLSSLAIYLVKLFVSTNVIILGYIFPETFQRVLLKAIYQKNEEPSCTQMSLVLLIIAEQDDKSMTEKRNAVHVRVIWIGYTIAIDPRNKS
jgi:hypothetical protein